MGTVPFCFCGLCADDEMDTVVVVWLSFFCFSFSASWNLDIRLTRLVVSARPAYMVLGRSFLSLR